MEAQSALSALATWFLQQTDEVSSRQRNCRNQAVQGTGLAAHQPTQWWRQRNSPKMEPVSWKQPPDLMLVGSANIAVPRVVDMRVVPDDCASRPQYPVHF